jgi:hypothetical protein
VTRWSASRLHEWADAIVSALGTYTEISPTGTGVKLILRGRHPGGGHKKQLESGEVEICDAGR